MERDIRLFSITLVISLLSMCAPTSAMGAPGASTPTAPRHIFYADPVKGSTSKGNGSRSKPWGSLQSIVEAKLIDGSDKSKGKIHAGDLLYLMNGNHGTVMLWGSAYVNTDFITLQALPSHVPILNGLTLSGSSKWVVRGIIFENPAIVKERRALLITGYSNQIIIDANVFRSRADGFRWTPKDWEKSSATFGISTNNTKNATITRNRISYVDNGMSLVGDSIIASNNTVDFFASDGIQFTASNSVISRNRITNHYGQWHTGKHPDGIQGFTAQNETSGANVEIDGNVILASTGTYANIPAVPSGEGDDIMQGISIFDGNWNNVRVTNNVVAAASYHGMGFYNIKNSTILNNTVVQQCPKFATWLGVFGDSRNVIVRNNIAHSFSLPEAGVLFDSNLAMVKSWQPWQEDILYANPYNIFVEWSPKTANFDFRLASRSYAIGRGNPRSLVPRDILYVNRNSQKVDMGAYVYVAP